jgi:Flp pilus assembly protein TadG
MHGRLRHLARDERGMSLVWTGIGFMAFFAATTLAIDVGMFMTARSQAQNSADAGALAGATALVFNDFNNRSTSGPAVQSARNTALINQVIGSAVDVKTTDVTFPTGPTGLNNRVKVDVFRTADRSNPVATFIGPIFGINTVNISATATAEASPANAMTCVKPFMIPDRWTENTNPAWDVDDTYEHYDNHGNELAVHDDYVAPGQPGYNGYNPTTDKGMQLVLRAGTGNNIEPTAYYSWSMPGAPSGEIGGDWYRQNIAGCNRSVVHPGDSMIQEPGAMSGPTIQGIEELIAQDPNATWDTTTNQVINSAKEPSPRVFPIPLYDPEYYAIGKKNGRNADYKVANWIGFFADRVVGNQIYGRITPILGVIDPNAGPAPAGSFPMAIRLVQ